MFKRKIYQKLLEWKQESDGKTALLIEGASQECRYSNDSDVNGGKHEL